MTLEHDDIEVTAGSGNIFADLGVLAPEEALLKANLTLQIQRVINARGWTQTQAAAQIGLPQSKVSLLLCGRLSGFSIERLLKILNRLAVCRRERHGGEQDRSRSSTWASSPSHAGRSAEHWPRHTSIPARFSAHVRSVLAVIRRTGCATASDRRPYRPNTIPPRPRARPAARTDGSPAPL